MCLHYFTIMYFLDPLPYIPKKHDMDDEKIQTLIKIFLINYF